MLIEILKLEKLLLNHKKWLKSKGGRQAIFTRVSIKYEIFRNALLKKAVFTKANLQWCTFKNCDIRNADFKGADLSWTNMSNSNL